MSMHLRAPRSRCDASGTGMQTKVITCSTALRSDLAIGRTAGANMDFPAAPAVMWGEWPGVARAWQGPGASSWCRGDAFGPGRFSGG